MLDGAVHERTICVGDVAVALSPSGAPGTLVADAGFSVTAISDDGFSLAPNEVTVYIL